MENKFNLSEKIRNTDTQIPDLDMIFVADVKEFIRLLKEEIVHEIPISTISIIELIDKLAGLKLIQEKGREMK